MLLLNLDAQIILPNFVVKTNVVVVVVLNANCFDIDVPRTLCFWKPTRNF